MKIACLILLLLPAITAYSAQPSQVAGRLPIAWSANDASRRNVRYEIDSPGGWTKFIEDEASTFLKAGVRTIQIHNPGGNTRGGAGNPSDGVMRFDQLNLASQQNLNFTNDFSAAFSKLTSDGVRIIAYVGSPDYPATREIYGDDFERYTEQVTPMLQAGVTLGLDATFDEPPESMAYRLALYMRHRGHQVLTELHPKKESRHWHSFDNCVLYPSFRSRSIETSHSGFDVWPKLDSNDRWYSGTTFIIFRNTMYGKIGDLAGKKIQLWRDPTPLVKFFNSARLLRPSAKLVPMVDKVTFEKLISMGLMEKIWAYGDPKPDDLLTE